MSANNFNWENILVALKIPVSDYDPSAYDFSCWWNETKENIQYTLLDHFKKGIICEEYESYNNRDFQGTVLFEIDFFTPKGDDYKTLQIILRNGYYADANLDYKIVSPDYYEDREYKTTEKQIANTIKKLHKILPTFGTELTQLGSMSNGEGIYKIK